MSRLLVEFGKDQPAATAIEYAIIATGISIVIVVAVNPIGTSLNSTFNSVSSALAGGAASRTPKSGRTGGWHASSGAARRLSTFCTADRVSVAFQSQHSNVRLYGEIFAGDFPLSDTANIVAATFSESGSVGEIAALRANLEVCWRRALNASNQNEKRSWLEMAEAWRILILTRGEDLDSDGQSESTLGDLIRHFCSNPLAL